MFKKRLTRLFLVAVYSLAGLSVVGCEDDLNSHGGASSTVIKKSDVVGDYNFVGYSGPLKRELEISFESDGSGSGQELSYGTYGIISAHKYIFHWSISGNKVKLNGVSASADTDGDTGSSTSWNAEFEMLYGLLVPGKNFIGGYAEYALSNKVKYSIDDYVKCEAKFNRSSGTLTVSIETSLGKCWPDLSFRYGVSLDYADYIWATDKNGKVAFDCGKPLQLFYDIIADLNAKKRSGDTLSQNDKDLMDTAQGAIDSYIRDFRNGNVDLRVGVDGQFLFQGETHSLSTTNAHINYYVTD